MDYGLLSQIDREREKEVENSFTKERGDIIMNVHESIQAFLKKPISEVPVNITTTLIDLNLCFIEYEDNEKLVVNVTGEDGLERLNIVFKQHIVNIAVVYDKDIKIDDIHEENETVLYR